MTFMIILCIYIHTWLDLIIGYLGFFVCVIADNYDSREIWRMCFGILLQVINWFNIFEVELSLKIKENYAKKK